MSSWNKPAPLPSNGPEDAEAQMRRALGLPERGAAPVAAPDRPAPVPSSLDRPMQQGQRRRFVRDGEVPVTLVSRSGGAEHHGARPGPLASPVNRVEAAAAALSAERAAREQAERALAESQAAVRDLQTKLGHETLAKSEALAAVQRAEAARHLAEDALREAEARLAAEQTAREDAEQRLRDALPKPQPKPKPAPRKPAAPRARGPQPVKWWLMGKDKKKKK